MIFFFNRSSTCTMNITNNNVLLNYFVSNKRSVITLQVQVVVICSFYFFQLHLSISKLWFYLLLFYSYILCFQNISNMSFLCTIYEWKLKLGLLIPIGLQKISLCGIKRGNLINLVRFLNFELGFLFFPLPPNDFK